MSVTNTPTFDELVVDRHFPERWTERSPRPGLKPRSAWLDAIPVDYPSAKPPAECARLHVETEMILLAMPCGRLVTCIPLPDRSDEEQQYIRSQVNL